jgi:hypothetical protein
MRSRCIGRRDAVKWSAPPRGGEPDAKRRRSGRANQTRLNPVPLHKVERIASPRRPAGRTGRAASAGSRRWLRGPSADSSSGPLARRASSRASTECPVRSALRRLLVQEQHARHRRCDQAKGHGALPVPWDSNPQLADRRRSSPRPLGDPSLSGWGTLASIRPWERRGGKPIAECETSERWIAPLTSAREPDALRRPR